MTINFSSLPLSSLFSLSLESFIVLLVTFFIMCCFVVLCFSLFYKFILFLSSFFYESLSNYLNKNNNNLHNGYENI